MDESFDALMAQFQREAAVARFKGEPISRYEAVDEEVEPSKQPVDNSQRIQRFALSVLSLVNASETVNRTLAAEWIFLAKKMTDLIEVLVDEETRR
jgi:hypothetical protein